MPVTARLYILFCELAMTRRMFVLSLVWALTACAAPKPKPEEEGTPFNKWLRKNSRWRKFRTKEEAEEAWKEDVEQAKKEKEWKKWKKEQGFPG